MQPLYAEGETDKSALRADLRVVGGVLPGAVDRASAGHDDHVPGGRARRAADSLPALVERASGLLDQAAVTLQGFDQSSGIVREAQSAIRDVARAAEAIASLARTIERNPNSLIFGD